LEVHGVGWSQVETLHGQIPTRSIGADASHNQGSLLQWYTALKVLPRFTSRTYPLLAETMTSDSGQGSGRLISKLEFYHGFILMSLLLRGVCRFSREVVSGGVKDPAYQRHVYRRVMAFLLCLGYIDPESYEYGKAPGELPNHVLDFLAIYDPGRQRGWKLAVLSNQHYGLVPSGAHQGDMIVVVKGSSVPFVLREAEGGTWKLVGSCYFFRIMAGEVVQEGIKGPPETFVLS
jgi:hypothetical protein